MIIYIYTYIYTYVYIYRYYWFIEHHHIPIVSNLDWVHIVSFSYMCLSLNWFVAKYASYLHAASPGCFARALAPNSPNGRCRGLCLTCLTSCCSNFQREWSWHSTASPLTTEAQTRLRSLSTSPLRSGRLQWEDAHSKTPQNHWHWPSRIPSTQQ